MKADWDEYTREELVDKIQRMQNTVNALVVRLGALEQESYFTPSAERLKAEIARFLDQVREK